MELENSIYNTCVMDQYGYMLDPIYDNVENHPIDWSYIYDKVNLFNTNVLRNKIIDRLDKTTIDLSIETGKAIDEAISSMVSEDDQFNDCYTTHFYMEKMLEVFTGLDLNDVCTIIIDKRFTRLIYHCESNQKQFSEIMEHFKTKYDRNIIIN